MRPKYWGAASIELDCLSWPLSTLNTRFYLGNTEPREDLLNGNRDNSEGLKYPRVASIESECLSWLPIMAVLDPEHTLDLGNTESSTICYHASYNMLSCISPVAIMQPSAIMQIKTCYHAGHNLLSCKSIYYNLLSCRIPYAIMRSTNTLSLLSATKANILSSSYCFLVGFAF